MRIPPLDELPADQFKMIAEGARASGKSVAEFYGSMKETEKLRSTRNASGWRPSPPKG